MKALRVWFAFLYLALALASFHLWEQTDDLWFTLGSCGFALASIRETLLFIKEFRQ